MIRVMENIDLAQCGMIYANAFPMEHWGIDWTAENATEYLRDFFEQKRFVGYVYEENDEVLGCIFALCKISGSKEEIYINEMAVLPDRQGQIGEYQDRFLYLSQYRPIGARPNRL